MNWVFEKILPFEKPDTRFGLRIKKLLYSGRSPFQKIQVFETSGFGRALMLDGIYQLTEKDEFIYHEMLCHLPLCCHPFPKKVLIVGGGDGGALEEVLKHKVEKVWMAEIDKKVIELSQRYLPTVSRGAFKDRRAKVIIGDGWQFLKNYKKFFDVIILDLSDPVGPAKNLISQKFYKDVKRALKSKGVISVQSGSLSDQEKLVLLIAKRLRKVFSSVKVHRACVPAYHAGEYAFTIASDLDLNKIDPKTIEKRIAGLKPKLRYYNSQIHFCSASLPPYLKKKFGQ
jgi:spermidine synthase